MNTDILVGKIVSGNMLAKEILTYNDLILEDLTEGIEDPVEMSIDVSKVGQAVAGTLRAGDTINVLVFYDLSSEEEEGEESLSSVPTAATVTELDENGEEVVVPITNTIAVPDAIDFTQFNTFADGMRMEEGDIAYSADGKYACEMVARNVRITGVYNSAGENEDMVAAAEGTMIATVIKVVVPDRMQSRIGLAFEQGNIRLTKVVDDVIREEKTIPEEVSDSFTEVEGADSFISEDDFGFDLSGESDTPAETTDAEEVTDEAEAAE